MFSHGLKSLLTSDPHLKIVGEKLDMIEAGKAVKSLRPDVIIWSHKTQEEVASAEVVALLDLQPGLKLISLNLQNNEMAIYQLARTPATDLQILLKAIKIPLLREANWRDGAILPLLSRNGDGDHPTHNLHRDGHPPTPVIKVSWVWTSLEENCHRAKEVCERAKKTCQASQQTIEYIRKARLLRRGLMPVAGETLPNRSDLEASP